MPATKIAKPYPHVYPDTDRQGVRSWRLRVPGRKTVTIKGTFGSPEFAANYRAAMEGVEAQPVEKAGIATKQNSIAALARDYLSSSSFTTLSKTTQKARRSLIEKFADSYGKLPVAGLARKHVVAIIEREAPGTARNLLSALRVLMQRAIDQEIIAKDPTDNVKRPKLSRGGWHSWTEAEIEQYQRQHPVGSQARLALALALYTGQRRSDLIRMGRQHIRDGGIQVVQQKTGTPLWIPLHTELKAILDATPAEHLTFITTSAGKPYSVGGLTHRVRLWALEAGLTGCPLHGLRKAACRRLAEAGCSASEIMAVSGHRHLGDVQIYVRGVDQARLASQAITRTEDLPTNCTVLPTAKKTEQKQ